MVKRNNTIKDIFTNISGAISVAIDLNNKIYIGSNYDRKITIFDIDECQIPILSLYNKTLIIQLTSYTIWGQWFPL